MLKKMRNILNRIEDTALVLMFSTMVLVIFYQVIMRYLFKNSSAWSEELGKFLFVWLTWVGISIGARRGEHIKIEMLTDRLSHVPAQLLNILSEVVVFIICAVTAYYSIYLVISQNHIRFAGIRISMSWGYLAVAVGCILMMMRNIISILDSVKAIKSGVDPRIDVGEV